MKHGGRNRIAAENQPIKLVFSMPAKESGIPDVVEKIARFLQQQGFGEQHAVSVVLRELLSNAVVHGSAGLSDALIRGEVTVEKSGMIALWVEDMGKGFDYRALDLRLPNEPPDGLQHRGLILVKALVQELSWNESGNRVMVRLHGEGERRGKHGSTR